MTRFAFSLIAITLFLTSFSFCNAQDLQVVVNPSIAWQGKVLSVKLVSAEGVAGVKARFLNQDFKLFRTSDDYHGVVGVPLNQKPGYYNLKLIITRADGKTQNLTKQLKVWATRFSFSKFWLKPSKNKLRRRSLINEEWAQIEKVLRIEEDNQFWLGKFAKPVKGKISQGFGHKQIINGRGAGSHRGTDFAVLNGTKVFAPNYGKVVFAKKLSAFGGTMVLDHGQGIHTLYFHLSKLIAPIGKVVTRGELIALSGNSGISSGPHLHWGMSVHNLRVDAMQWVKHEI
ncbi:MAG: M23 family metallopeptidase [Candidatus Margulisbacteria bacterium]|nr:M23 family metallopeptidase [Candidatus Margulisiibacteriota bacterium]